MYPQIPMYLKGQVMTAPVSGGAATFTAFSNPGAAAFDTVMVHNPGPVAVYVLSSTPVAGGGLAADTTCLLVASGEKAYYRKKDGDTGLSLLSFGAVQNVAVFLGHSQH